MSRSFSKFFMAALALGAAAVMAGCSSNPGEPPVGVAQTAPAGSAPVATASQVKIIGNGPPAGMPGSAGYAPNDPGAAAQQAGIQAQQAAAQAAAAKAKAAGG